MKKILFVFLIISSAATASPKKFLYLKCIEIPNKNVEKNFDGPVGVFVGKDTLKFESDSPLQICKETDVTIEFANDCREKKLYGTLNLVSLRMIAIVELWGVSRSEFNCEMVKNPRD